jgi:hypothetical protein
MAYVPDWAAAHDIHADLAILQVRRPSVPWLIVSVGALLVLLLPGATHGLLPFTAIMAVEMLVTTCLIIAAGVITESQAWVTVAILCSSLGINILGYVFAHLSGISAYIFGMRVRWTGTAWTVLIAELLMVPPASGDDLLHPIQEDRFSLMTKAHLY